MASCSYLPSGKDSRPVVGKVSTSLYILQGQSCQLGCCCGQSLAKQAQRPDFAGERAPYDSGPGQVYAGPGPTARHTRDADSVVVLLFTASLQTSFKSSSLYSTRGVVTAVLRPASSPFHKRVCEVCAVLVLPDTQEQCQQDKDAAVAEPGAERQGSISSVVLQKRGNVFGA